MSLKIVVESKTLESIDLCLYTLLRSGALRWFLSLYLNLLQTIFRTLSVFMQIFVMCIRGILIIILHFILFSNVFCGSAGLKWCMWRNKAGLNAQRDCENLAQWRNELTCIKSRATFSEAVYSWLVSLSCRAPRHVLFCMSPQMFGIPNMESRDEGIHSHNGISISSRLTHSERELLLFWHLESRVSGFMHLQ